MSDYCGQQTNIDLWEHDVSTAAGWTGREARALRQAYRMSIRAYASHLGVSPAAVTNWERRGDQARLRTETQQILDTDVTRASDDVKERFHALIAEPPSAGAQDAVSHQTSADTSTPQPVQNETIEVELRRAWLASLDIDEAKLDYLEAATLDAIDKNERLPPASLAPHVRNLRNHVQTLIERPQHPPARHRLYVVAAHLSGMQAVLALDMGHVAPARSYAREAFELATATQAPDAAAWARATQSLVEYYAGCFHDSLAFARDGLRRSPNGVHSVRLAVNGEARALGRMGDRYGVDAAVGHAFTIIGAHTPSVGVSASLTTSGYCRTRAAANAATAYLSLGNASKVEEYAMSALPALDAAGINGPCALTRLDLATALVLQGREPERAADFVRQALTATVDHRYHSVGVRASEFIHTAKRFNSLAAVRDVAELVAVSRQPTNGGGQH